MSQVTPEGSVNLVYPERISSSYRFFKGCFTLFTVCFLAASLGYLIMKYVLGQKYVFGALFRMFLYHEEHAFQYIALMSAIFSLVSTTALFSSRLNQERGKLFLMYLGCVMTTVVLASPLGGIMWTLHDMQAGYFLEGYRFYSALWQGACVGLCVGWIIILGSMPYNLFGILAGWQCFLFAVRMRSHMLNKPTAS